MVSAQFHQVAEGVGEEGPAFANPHNPADHDPVSHILLSEHTDRPLGEILGSYRRG